MTVPVSRIAQSNPSVIAAGGAALALFGLMLTQNPRMPYGNVQSFGAAPSVGSYFGQSSLDYAQAVTYFSGFQNEIQIPSLMNVAAAPMTNLGAWLRGASILSLTTAQLSAIAGTLSVNVDGYAFTVASVNLSSATSPSAAAGLLQTQLNTTLPAGAVSAVTGGVVAPQTCTFTGGINGNLLTVSATTGAAIEPGAIITAGAAANTQIVQQLSGVIGGAGTYAVAILQNATSYGGIASTAGVAGGPQNVAAGIAMTATYGKLTLTGANASGTFSAGQTLSGGTTTAGTILWGQLTGTGGAAGTYVVSPSQTVAAATITATATPLSVTFDSISGGFQIASGQACPAVLPGFGSAPVGGTLSASSAAAATGTAAPSLKLDVGSAVTLSQGIAAMTPQNFMSTVVRWTQNFGDFWTAFDPDAGSSNGPTQKMNFAAWVQGTNQRYAYLAWDADPAPTVSSSAPTCFAQQVTAAGYTGVAPIYDPGNSGIAAFVAGCIAAINFDATNGRTTIAFRTQPGLLANVTDPTVYDNLQANGYNTYSAYAAANQQFIFLYPGSISGQFAWLDSYVNQIWLNAEIQLDMIDLLMVIPSIPYNAPGYAIVEGAMQTTINMGLNFGSIRAGVPLSALQAITVNTEAGVTIDGVLSTAGWYVKVQPAPPTTRQARNSPVIYLWYMDGQSIQKLVVNTVDLL